MPLALPYLPSPAVQSLLACYITAKGLSPGTIVTELVGKQDHVSTGTEGRGRASALSHCKPVSLAQIIS